LEYEVRLDLDVGVVYFVDTQKELLHKDANISIIFMRSYNTFLMLDNDMLNSLYIQLFVFENYNKKLFTPVILNLIAKVFKLKI